MIIKEYRLLGLKNVVDFYQQSDILPITHERARSQQKNPRGEQSDIVLMVAIDSSEKVLAFAGALPSYMVHEQNNIPVMWNTCWWSAPSAGPIAVPLLLKLFAQYKNRVLFNDLSEYTRELMIRLKKYTLLPPVKGRTWYLRMNFIKFIPNKLSVKPLHVIFRIADWLFNGIWDRWLLLRLNENKNCSINIISDLNSSDLKQFIQSYNNNDLTQIGIDDLNWITGSKWLSTNTDNETVERSKKYPFSLLARSFSWHPVEIVFEGKRVAFALLSERDGHFKLPYYWGDSAHIQTIMSQLIRYVVLNKGFAFSVFRSDVVDALLNENCPSLYEKTIVKYRGYSNDLKIYSPELKQWQDGDGDAVFT